MASRRKSAKPTNKLRQVHIEDDDNDLEEEDEEDCGDEIMRAAFASLSTPNENNFQRAIKNFKGQVVVPAMHIECPLSIQTQPNHTHLQQQQQQQQQRHQSVRSTVLLSPSSDEQTVPTSQGIEEPLLALPSDVYNDFEALRSVTKLDSPALMRRLLKYYSKLTSSTVDREKKLDNVIEGIRGRCSSTTKEQTSTITSSSNGNTNTAVVLDLSVQRNIYEHHPSTLSSRDVSDDDAIDSNDPESSPRPLDLTLQKDDNTAPLSESGQPLECSNVQRGTASSLFSTCFQTPTASSSCVYSSTDMNQAAPYVINLEPLTTTIQLSEPLQPKDNMGQRSELFLPSVAIGEGTIKEGSLLHTHSRKSLVSNIFTGSQNIKPTLMPATTQLPKTESKPTLYPPSALFPMHNAPLPSYKEAVSSSLFSKRKANCIDNDTRVTNTNRSVVFNDDKNNNNLSLKKANIDFANNVMNPEGRHISVLQLSPDFHNTKSFQTLPPNTPDNFLLESSHQKPPLSQEISTPNFLLADSMSILSSRLSSTRQGSPKFEERAGLTRPNYVEQSVQRIQTSHLTKTITGSPPPSAMVSNNTIHTILSTSAPSTHNGYTQSTPMPLQSLLMSQTPDGAVSNVVAIPVLQSLPEGYTTLQHFTFEPAVPLPAKSEIQNSSVTTGALPLQPIIVSAPIATTSYNSFPSNVGPITNLLAPATTVPPSASSTSQNGSDSLESGKEWVKLKPGRPKGRTGKMNSPRKIQNKGMKLLTENSLFPGVYTSILKLPWSKRTRNKPKAKPEDAKTSHAGNIEEHRTTTDSVDVESHGRNVMTDSNYIPSELIVNIKDTISEPGQDQLTDIRNENILQRHTIALDQQHQQQFPHQYQIHVNEEHQRAANEFDQPACPNQSPCTSPPATSHGNNVFTDSLHHSTMNIKREISEPSEMLCSEIRHNVMLSSASIAAGPDQPSVSNSQDPIMLIYPNIGPNGSKSKKRRGRPPKKPMVEPKVHQDSFLFPVDSLFQSPDSISDASFLHGSGSNLTIIPSNSTPLSQEFTLMSPTSLSSSLSNKEKAGTSIVKTSAISPDFPSTLREHDETTLENRIIFLTNQIEMEMARGVNPPPNKDTCHINTSTIKHSEQSMNPGQSMEMSSSTVEKLDDKLVPGVKRRRKKTSRLLKSNENFVYATFRFKPRGGSGNKKSKKKRKTNTTTMAANAETIANLRNKKLKCLDAGDHKSDSETTRNEFNVQTWKFHEQYPSESRQARSPIPSLSLTSCAACGGPVRKIDEVPSNLSICGACSKGAAGRTKGDNTDIQSHVDIDVYNPTIEEEEEEEEDDESYTSCITCGKRFEGFLDSDSQCDTCRRNRQSFIGSSKLFSIPSSTQQNSDSFPNVSDSIASTSHSDSMVDGTLRIASFDPNTPLTTDGILYCSLCRMQFTKISEYLLHLKDTHEATPPRITPSILQKPDDIMENMKLLTDSAPRRIKSTLKTKKSLSHKTITCPVEDCPLFFRHQREMDHHLRKVHLSNSLRVIGEGGPPTQSKDISMTPTQVSDFKDVGKNACPSMDDPHPSVFNQQSDRNAMALTLEENGDSRVIPGQDQEKPLRCSFCNFRCRQKNAMTWHMRKHPEAASQHRCYSNASSE